MVPVEVKAEEFLDRLADTRPPAPRGDQPRAPPLGATSWPTPPKLLAALDRRAGLDTRCSPRTGAASTGRSRPAATTSPCSPHCGRSRPGLSQTSTKAVRDVPSHRDRRSRGTRVRALRVDGLRRPWRAASASPGSGGRGAATVEMTPRPALALGDTIGV
ncbi:hypothetical protein HBB16_01455 [Pseudonocardia sp. MCCB 268]|nr:hypothetical protein [Pseudonocardia cytotoxica]